MSVIQYLLVHAHKAGKLNDMKSFFADCGDSLMRGPDAEQWSAWFALPYISAPSSHPTFQVLSPHSLVQCGGSPAFLSSHHPTALAVL